MALDKTFSSGEILSAADVNSHLLGLWTPIDKRVIAAGSPVASVSFQSIDSNFRFFRITAYCNPNANVVQLRFNNDSGNNYATQTSVSGGTSVVASRQTSQPQIICDSGGVLSGVPTITTMTIGKTLATVGAAVTGTTVRESTVVFVNFGGVWLNTAALINRIDFFTAGTISGVFALEGMRGV